MLVVQSMEMTQEALLVNCKHYHKGVNRRQNIWPNCFVQNQFPYVMSYCVHHSVCFASDCLPYVFLTRYIDSTVYVTVRKVFKYFFLNISYRVTTWWVLVYGAISRSQCLLRFESAFGCIFYLLRLVTLLYVFSYSLFVFFQLAK